MNFDWTTVNSLIAVTGTLTGAAIGVFGNRNTNKMKDKKYNAQVEYICKETLCRTEVYLNHMIEEEYETFLINLEGRVDGFKAIEKLLSEFPLGTISTKQVFAVYRTRELLLDIIFDLSLFQDNKIKTKQFVADAEFQISYDVNEKAKELLNNKIKIAKRELETDYESRLYKNLKEYFELTIALKTQYHLISDEIYKKILSSSTSCIKDTKRAL
ncbi:hypothetical protein [Bacillus cereus group sp. BfR-BA-01409]|uniref:hypothetical protein n=1 Tax=Bacillus cereus group sp. BfR-BA-01409 TaxID=2920338 RepID=UPI001F580FF1